MSRRGIPTLGHPSRIAAIRSLLARGVAWEDIDHLTNMAPGAARSYFRDVSSNTPDEQLHFLEIALHPDQMETLKAARALRTISAAALANLILQQILDDNLIDAVLDDKVTYE